MLSDYVSVDSPCPASSTMTGDCAALVDLVDEETCNPLACWHRMGEPADLTEEQLAFLKAAGQPAKKVMTPETTAEGCSLAEYQTHFALWAMLNSPLIIGCDIRKIDEASKKILQNRDLIAINQDPEVRTCYMLSCECSPGTFALVRLLSDGSYAAGVFNFSEENMRAGFTFWDLGISAAAGQKLFFHDCLTHEDMGVLAENCCVRLEPHECKVFRMKSVD